jgi:hypothetical protein
MAVYDAFVSYSHAKDKPIAAALQSVIQKLGKPWYRRRALRVFRDDTSLSATPSLWPAIEQALGQSRYLILLASPEAAASQWVNKEVPGIANSLPTRSRNATTRVHHAPRRRGGDVAAGGAGAAAGDARIVTCNAQRFGPTRWSSGGVRAFEFRPGRS